MKPWGKLEAEMRAAGVRIEDPVTKDPGDDRYQKVKAAYMQRLEQGSPEANLQRMASGEEIGTGVERAERMGLMTGALQPGAEGEEPLPTALTQPAPGEEDPGFSFDRLLQAARSGFGESNVGGELERLGAIDETEPFEPQGGATGVLERIVRGGGAMAGSPVALGVPIALGGGPLALALGFGGERLLRAVLEGDEDAATIMKEAGQEALLGAAMGKAGQVAGGLASRTPASVRALAGQTLPPMAEAGTLAFGGEGMRALETGEAPSLEEIGGMGAENLGQVALMRLLGATGGRRRGRVEPVETTGELAQGRGEGGTPPGEPPPSPDATVPPPAEPAVEPRWARELEPGRGEGGTPPGPTPPESRPPSAPAPSGPVLDQQGVARVFGTDVRTAEDRLWIEPSDTGKWLITEDGLSALGGPEAIDLRMGGAPVEPPVPEMGDVPRGRPVELPPELAAQRSPEEMARSQATLAREAGYPVEPEPAPLEPPTQARPLPPQPREQPVRPFRQALQQERAEPVEALFDQFRLDQEAAETARRIRAEADASTELARDALRRLTERRLNQPEEPPPPVSGELEARPEPSAEMTPAELARIRALVEEIRAERARGAPPGEPSAATDRPASPPAPTGQRRLEPAAVLRGTEQPPAPPEPLRPADPQRNARLRDLAEAVEDNAALASGQTPAGEPVGRDIADSARQYLREYLTRLKGEAAQAQPEELTQEVRDAVRRALTRAESVPEPPVGLPPTQEPSRPAGRAAPPPGRPGATKKGYSWQTNEPLTIERAQALEGRLETIERELDAGFDSRGPFGATRVEGLVAEGRALRDALGNRDAFGRTKYNLALEEKARAGLRTRKDWQDVARYAPGEPYKDATLEEARMAVGRAIRSFRRQKPGTADYRKAEQRMKNARGALAAAEIEARREGRLPPEDDGEGGGGGDVTLGSGLGALGDVGSRRVKLETPITDPAVRAILTPVESGKVPLRDRLAKPFRWVKEAVGEYLGYHPELNYDRAFQNGVRLHQDVGVDVRDTVGKELVEILGKLDRGKFRGEEEQLRDVTVLGDLLYEVQQGREVMGNLSEAQLTKAIGELEGKLTPAVRAAREADARIMQQYATEGVKRGWFPASVLERPEGQTYYPHQVIEVSNVLAEMLPGLPKELRDPYRPWAKKREGSQRRIDVDYLKVKRNYLSRFRYAMAVEDFAKTWLPARDILAGMSKAERAAVFGTNPETGEPRGPRGHLDLYDVPGRPQRYMAYQYRPYGWQPVGAGSMMEAAMVDALYGGGERFYLVPEPMGRFLHQMRYRPKYTKLVDALHQGTRNWTRLLFDTLGVKFRMMNFIGDEAQLYLQDLGAFVNQLRAPTIGRAIIGRSQPEMKAFEAFLKRHRVDMGATFFGAQAEAARFERRLSRYGPTKERIRNLIWSPLEAFETASGWIEMWPRVAKALTDWERIRAGEQVVGKAMDFGNMSQEAAAGKAARVGLVDYGQVSPDFRNSLRGMWAPFATWHVEMFRFLPRYLKDHPGEAAAKILLPAAALWLWNNRVQGEVEKDLPTWLRQYPFHYNTGRKDEDGNNIVHYGNFGTDVMPRFVGVARLPHALGRYARGELGKPGTPEAAERFLEEALTGAAWAAVQTPLRTYRALKEKGPEAAARVAVGTAAEGIAGFLGELEQLSPPVQLVHALYTNVDPRTRRKIVQDRDRGTTREWEQKAAYLTRQLLPPVSMMMTALERAARRPGTATSPLGRLWEGLRQGPLLLDPREVVTARVDPELGRQERLHEAATRGKRARAEVLQEFEEGVIDAATGRGTEKLSEAARAMAERGVQLRREDLDRRLRTSVPFLRKLLQAKLERADTPEEREAARKALLGLRKAQGMQLLKQTPKAARPFVAEEAQR